MERRVKDIVRGKAHSPTRREYTDSKCLSAIIINDRESQTNHF